MDFDSINPMAMIALNLALLGLIGPALVYLGIALGTQRRATEDAHSRIDRMEAVITAGFAELRKDVRAINTKRTGSD